MRRIGFIVQKEFIQVFRTKTMVLLIFVMPVIQLLILSNAATYEIRNLRLHVIDLDRSSMSRDLVRRFTASGYFVLADFSFHFSDAYKNLEINKADLILRIPAHFERDCIRNQGNEVQLIVNAVDGSAGSLAGGYAAQIISSFQQELQKKLLPDAMVTVHPAAVEYTNRFNAELNYQTFMVPGLVVLLVTMIGAFLTSMNIVKEKETGTIEQLNVTPIRKSEFIIGKLLPFWILGMVELTIGLAVGYLAFDISMAGNPALIYLFASVYLLVVLGLGLFVSTLADTQQQAMFIAWFILVLFILLSGLFTPVESMPAWAQRITWFNPVSYFIRVVRMVMLKGSTFRDIQDSFLIILLMAVVVNTAAVLRHRKTSV